MKSDLLYSFSVYELIIKRYTPDRETIRDRYVFSTYKEAEEYGNLVTYDSATSLIYDIKEIKVYKNALGADV